MGSGTSCITVRCSGRSMNAAYTSRGRNNVGHVRELPSHAYGPMEAAGAVDAKNAPTAPWKTHRAGFPQLPQAIIVKGQSDVPSLTPSRCKRCCRTSVNDQPGRSSNAGYCEGAAFCFASSALNACSLSATYFL